ncbi:MAG: 3-deoxy-manno-octulosonate cytidylyltransferase [Planctomycetota bacterium]
MKSCVVIPARFASTRLPGKMLLAETGRPLVQHTYEAACGAAKPSAVFVATDHPEIRQAVEAAGGTAVETSPDCASGTDRVAEVARQRPEFDIVVNLQGDEPELDPAAIDQVIALLERRPDAAMATLATPILDPRRVADPSNVKVVFDAAGRALYFSRSPIPYIRDTLRHGLSGAPIKRFQHIGLYAYRREFLLKLAAMPPSPLEQAEKLEQLRVLEAGEAILVGQVASAAPGIDTPADYQAFVDRWRSLRRAA